ncbi:MAG: enoyl-CoA hydratase/isomerase family protein [Proteobacteria bacterium]|nr:enoyl-CoA hydratase/isomerase family protein [Pseudomonadota bacterium]
MEPTYQHWRLDLDHDHIMWLTLDRQGASVNSLNAEVFAELDSVLSFLETNLPIGLIIQSGKTKGFIAGADIKQFVSIPNVDEAFDLIRQAQTILDRLSRLPIPTLALIRGFCLGGGLELALACRYRLAEENGATLLGLPEVKLGLHPGWGGTVRLPRLIGPYRALPFTLKGQPVSAAKAARMGIVDAALPERILETAARHYILKNPPQHKPSLLSELVRFNWVRVWIGKWIEKNAAKKINPQHYPAPFAIINNWVHYSVYAQEAMVNEARSIAQLMVGPTSRELVRAFFLQEQLKAFAKNARCKPNHVHVVGSGAMGGDIAAWCVYKGFTVTLQDQSPDKIAPAIARAHKLLAKKLAKPQLIQAAMDKLQPDLQGRGVCRADVVIEAIFEDLNAKRQLFAAIEPHLKPEAILATNTSSIRLEEIASILKDPTRLIGLHFFNPVAKMMLVEIIRSDANDQLLLGKAASFVNALAHYPLPVASRPGFLINRMLMPYLIEALIIHQEGVPIEAIDRAAKEFGMPMGPMELSDHVGLDIVLSVAEHLSPYYGFTIPEKIATMVKEGHLGLKSRRGFYRYDRDGQIILPKPISFPIPDITDRLILRLCNEAVACLDEQVVSSPDLLDAGMIYGVGFAPFRGGPIEYVRNSGPNMIKERLAYLSRQYGERFNPHPQWEKWFNQ